MRSRPSTRLNPLRKKACRTKPKSRNLVDIVAQSADSEVVPSLSTGGKRMDQQADFRRAVGSTVWHWNSNCPKWPQHSFECTRTSPKSGERCTECAGQHLGARAFRRYVAR